MSDIRRDDPCPGGAAGGAFRRRGRRWAGRQAGRRAAAWLGLAATPTFALMALASAVAGAPPDLLCRADATSPLSGMTAMYGLMSLFHLPPWLRLATARRGDAGRR